MARIEDLLGGEPEFVHKPSGYVLIDGQEVARTLQCGHCGQHWVAIKGSGTRRGFCHVCERVLCGKENCLRYHVPREARLDFEDGGGLSEGAALKDRVHLIEKYPGIILP